MCQRLRLRLRLRECGQNMRRNHATKSCEKLMKNMLAEYVAAHDVLRWCCKK
jgi:hypothetical protein